MTAARRLAAILAADYKHGRGQGGHGLGGLSSTGVAKLYLGSDDKAVTCFRRSVEINRNHWLRETKQGAGRRRRMASRRERGQRKLVNKALMRQLLF